ncbi:Hsp70 family protein [Sessilibacter corallicola]|uniref:Molecular chaperone HscC n=1 Tax=Sessilibacter corallicola TaxID=2904075 RepID=A0ABQ0AAL7_9GAMM
MYVGIDLGTTHSAIAVLSDGEVTLIKNIHGDYLTPSVVGISDNGEWLVGKTASERLVTHPDKTVAEFKRYMGSQKRFRLSDQSLTPEELSAIVLKSLKEDIERSLGKTITEAVISVPAYFNNQQRQATFNAAKLANIKVERLINEPSAAALAYSLQEQTKAEATYMIVDLGGGTLDISVIEVMDSIIEIHASAGDNYLGGANFTDAIVDQILKQWQLNENQLSSVEKSKLLSLSEAAKRKLSSTEKTTINVYIQKKLHQYILTRDNFEKMCKHLIDKLRRPILRALQDSRIEISELSGVILVGGATRMQLIRSQIAKLSSQLPMTQYSPDLAIAMGTAIQANLKSQNQSLSDIIMTDVCPYTLGVEIHNETNHPEFLPIIERNNTIPISRSRTVYTKHPDQKQVNIRVFQGESFNPKDNVFLGKMIIDLPKSNKIEEIILTYTYDINGVLEVESTIMSSNRKDKIYLQNDNQLTEMQLATWSAQLEKLKTLPKDQEKNIALLHKLERLFEENLGETRTYISNMIQKLTLSLDTHDHSNVENTVQQIQQELQKLEQ